MNSNTKLRISVPKSLYESVQAELNRNTAPKTKGSLNENAIVDSVLAMIKTLPADTIGMIATAVAMLAGGSYVGGKMTQQSKEKGGGDASGGKVGGVFEKNDKQEVTALSEAIKRIMEKKDAKKEADKKKMAADKKKEADKKAADKKKEADKKKAADKK